MASVGDRRGRRRWPCASSSTAGWTATSRDGQQPVPRVPRPASSCRRAGRYGTARLPRPASSRAPHARRDDPRRCGAARRGAAPAAAGRRPCPRWTRPCSLAVPVDGRPDTASTCRLGDYRLVATDDRRRRCYVTGLPAGGAQDVIGRLVVVEVIAIALALLGGGVAGAVLVRRRAAAAGTGRRHRRQGQRPAAGPRRGRAGRAGAATPTRAPRSARSARALNQMLDHVGARAGGPAGQRDAAAPVRRRRQPRAAHAAGRDPRLRRADPARLSSPPDAEHALARIASQAERMTTLVEDLLLLARLDAGRPLERAAGRPDPAGPRRGQRRPRRRPGPPLAARPARRAGRRARRRVRGCTQVLTNLLANARTHTPPGTTVTVGLRRGDGGARLDRRRRRPGHRPGPAAARVRAVRPRLGRRGRGRPAAPGWAWRSSTRSWPRTAAT